MIVRAIAFATIAAGAALAATFGCARVTTPARLAAGRALFLHNCARCHGADARGDEGPDLHDVQVSDRTIVNTIARGIPHEMPAFGRKLSRDDLDALVAYVRALDAA